jgi:hypothetical protein
MYIELLLQFQYGIINYFGISFLYYWYHRFLHSKYSGPLYKYHYLNHHKKDFPLKRIRAASYGTLGNGGWFESGGELVFGIPVTFFNLLYLDNINNTIFY